MKNRTFNIPNTSDRFLQGVGNSHIIGNIIEAGLPNITGNVAAINGSSVENGAFYKVENEGQTQGSQWYTSAVVKMDASLSNPIYGNSTTVQPPAISTNFCIKY